MHHQRYFVTLVSLAAWIARLRAVLAIFALGLAWIRLTSLHAFTATDQMMSLNTNRPSLAE
jgi:hypothetical protein